MKKQQDAPRLLNMAQAMNYTGIGQTNLRKWCNEIGATVKIGRKCLYDKNVIDQALTEKRGLA